MIAYWDNDANRPRVAVGYVGEAGIKPETLYCWDSDRAMFVEVTT